MFLSRYLLIRLAIFADEWRSLAMSSPRRNKIKAPSVNPTAELLSSSSCPLITTRKIVPDD
jgi:hypothetical protein